VVLEEDKFCTAIADVDDSGVVLKELASVASMVDTALSLKLQLFSSLGRIKD